MVKKQTNFPEIEDKDDNNKESQIFSNEEEEKTIQLVTEKEKAKTIVRKVRQPSANSTKDKLDDFTEKRMEEQEDLLAMHQKKSGDKKKVGDDDDDLDKNKNDSCVDDESKEYYSGRFPSFFSFPVREKIICKVGFFFFFFNFRYIFAILQMLILIFELIKRTNISPLFPASEIKFIMGSLSKISRLPKYT